MPPTGSTFTDWQQVEKERRLLMNEDFSWSEPPKRSRRRVTDEPIRARRMTQLAIEPRYSAEPDYSAESYYDYDAPPRPGAAQESWDQPTEVHSHFDEMMAEWNAAYGEAPDGFDHDDLARYTQAQVREDHSAAFDLADPGTAGQSGRRTVVITGRGDDRYMPAPRRRPSSDLRFHERSGFSPDRAGLWAVLLGVALLLGAIVH
jgi:hypothetical protein